MFNKKTLSLCLLSLMFSFPALAQDASSTLAAPSVPAGGPQGEIARDHQDIKADTAQIHELNSDIKQDKSQIQTDNQTLKLDRQQLQQDKAAGNTAAIPQDHQALKQEKLVKSQDVHKLHHQVAKRNHMRHDRSRDRHNVKHVMHKHHKATEHKDTTAPVTMAPLTVEH